MDDDHSVRFDARFDSPAVVGRPPGGAPPVRFRDILLIVGDANADNDPTEDLAMLPGWVGEPWDGAWVQPPPFELVDGLVLTKLDSEESELVLNACSHRGHYFAPARQYGEMYSLVTEVDAEATTKTAITWDADELITDALAMSRLVIDNGYSTDFAARITDYEDGEKQVIPFGGSPAYRLKDTRDWMTNEELAGLSALLGAYRTARASLPQRVTDALWLAEYTTQVRWLDVIVPLLVVAFESFANTGRQLVSRQFRERVVAITRDAGCEIDVATCKRLYDDRSQWVHGQRVSGFGKPQSEGVGSEGPTNEDQRDALADAGVMQQALRAVLRRCIENSEFRSRFSSGEAIRSQWPIAI